MLTRAVKQLSLLAMGTCHCQRQHPDDLVDDVMWSSAVLWSITLARATWR